MNANELIARAALMAKTKHHIELEHADAHELHEALSDAVMQDISGAWAASEANRAGKRRAYYMSLEYLTGRMIYNNLYSLGLLAPVRESLMKRGVDITALEDIEDAALGNGGLGRLAACFLDSAATHDIPLDGYGLRYRFGLFKQDIIDNAQAEFPDDWTRWGDPWSIRRNELAVTVRMKTGDVSAVPYDMPVIGFGGKNIATLRLWQAESLNELDLAKFNAQKYSQAAANKNRAEDITKVLYPNDTLRAGKLLRLKQQYVLCSATLQDILRRGSLDVAIQLNDTHPVLAVPELMRLLMQNGEAFESAVEIARGIFSYTNHTVMTEALEKWDISLIAAVAPEILQIIRRIDAISPIRIIENKQVHMARLAVFMSHKVNGVARMHSELIKRELFADFCGIYPERFINETNGVTQRRWLGLCDPGLSALIEKRIGSGFITDLDELSALQIDDELIREFIEVKRMNKQRLAERLMQTHNMELNPNFIFDVQIKRLHEYKRQLMNAFSVLAIYHMLKTESIVDFTPTAFILGGKAAPGYARAKAIIRFINEIAGMINADEAMKGKLGVFFVPDYNCSWAELIIPAADVSEQISPAGTEASGTSNMKLMLNGAVTLGTRDGANVEIFERAGEAANYPFGASIDELNAIRDAYDPRAVYEADPRLKKAVDTLIDGTFPDADGGFRELYDSLLIGASWHKPDHYFIFKDFEAYLNAKLAINRDYKDEYEFARKCLINVRGAGVFSSDRTVKGYARDIWRV